MYLIQQPDDIRIGRFGMREPCRRVVYQSIFQGHSKEITLVNNRPFNVEV